MIDAEHLLVCKKIVHGSPMLVIYPILSHFDGLPYTENNMGSTLLGKYLQKRNRLPSFQKNVSNIPI